MIDNGANSLAMELAGTESKEGKEKKLLSIRTRFAYMMKRWKKIWEAGDRDMLALGPEGPLDPIERAVRKDLRRPYIHLDQLKQYPRNLVNQIRLNPQGIKVVPGGDGSTDETAVRRGNRIRAIQVENNASQAYLMALQCAAERGYGVVTLETEFVRWDSLDLKIKIVREADPNAVIYDPDFHEADASDIQDGFKIWNLPIDEFKRQFPDAQIMDFNLGHQVMAPAWIHIERQLVQLARYSYFQQTPKTIYWVDAGGDQPMKIVMEDLPGYRRDGEYLEKEGQRSKILATKKAIQKTVKQCITNGIEDLGEVDWPGRWIPIFPMFGPESFIRENGISERMFESYIRPAIDGQLGFDMAKSNQVETAGMVPKSTYMMYEGQEDTATDWQNINKIPTPFALVKPIVDGATGQVLPLPQRTDFNPQIEAMEIMAESFRRAIQAAIGSHGFTINDDTNVKSGKAVNALKAQSDIGQVHFQDSYENTIRNIGRAIDDLLDKVEDTPRDVAMLKQDGTREMIRINEPHVDRKTGEIMHHRYSTHEPDEVADSHHDIEIDTGSFGESAKERTRQFTEKLLASSMGPLVADVLVKIEDLGPYTEELQRRLMPPQFQKSDGETPIPPEIQQQLAQRDQALQAVNAHAKQLEEQLAELLDKAKAEAVKAASAERMAHEKLEMERAIEVEEAERQLAKERAEVQRIEADKQLAEQKLAQEREIVLLKLDAEREIEIMRLDANKEQLARGLMKPSAEASTGELNPQIVAAIEAAVEPKPVQSTTTFERDILGNIVAAVTTETVEGRASMVKRRLFERDAQGNLLEVRGTDNPGE